ncbi:MAG: hypothetical protein ACOYIA_03040 [Eubacteriales bacterium]|jgi:hypothetical protein
MGFGLLFIGYFIAFIMSINGYSFVFRLAGYVVMALALIRLRRFERRFYYAYLSSLLLIIFGIWDFIYGIADKLKYELPAWISAAKPASGGAIFITEAALNVTLLLSIAALAGGVGLVRQQRGAWRNVIITGVYYILAARMLFFPGNIEANRYLLPTALLLWLCWRVLNLILIFSCYMRICPEGDEDMPEREPRFKSIREFFDKTARSKKETQEFQTGGNTLDGSDDNITKGEGRHKK